jgi:hypothetical protein
MQVPMHPFLLLVTFNAFSQSAPPWLAIAVTWWGKLLTFCGPSYVALEGLSSLLFAQKTGQIGRDIADEAESYQFVILIAAAAAFVAAAWWIVIVRHVLCRLNHAIEYCTGVPNSCHLSFVVHVAGCGTDSIPVPCSHWFPATTHQRGRGLAASTLPRV